MVARELGKAGVELHCDPESLNILEYVKGLKLVPAVAEDWGKEFLALIAAGIAAALKSAQPQSREGEIIPSSKGAWKDEPINAAREVIVGYYDIFAEALNDAIVIAKGNCEFEYGTTARIEVRPTKMKDGSVVYV